MRFFKKAISIFFLAIFISSCSKMDNASKVVVYTSVDRVFASKIFKDFENKTGIKVLAVYDTEASKAVGLEKRLLMEKSHPKADIFWNSEPIRTARLAKENLFKPRKKISVKNYQKKMYYDPDKRWFGIGKRVRVIIVNTKQLNKKEYPKNLEDLWADKYKNKVAISSPFIGTASAHFAALYNKFGEKRFKHIIEKIKNSHTAILAGNSVVKDVVGEGKYNIGLVDSDDALAGIKSGLPIKTIYYDQNSTGVFAIIGTVAQLKNSPNPKEAERFMEYLLSPETEKKLISIGAVQYSVFKSADLKEPKQWTEQPDKLLKALKSSYELIKETL